MNTYDKKLIKELHLNACKANKETYIDPKTGFQVFTSIHHKKRGHCCESGCRHCPFGFKAKP
jgi:hypothetical protein